MPATTPKGGHKILQEGERLTYESLSRAIRAKGETDPVVVHCLELLAKMASGRLRGRYCGDQYRAIREILDRVAGKPVEAIKHSGEIKHRVEIVESDDGAA